MSQVQDQLQGLPGYDLVMDYYNDFAGEKFNMKINPYEDENGNKRRLPKDITTPKEQKVWKKVQNRAWSDDKCFMGSCGVGMDCGLGLAPLVVLLFPAIGPIMLYVVHARLIHMTAQEINLPTQLVAKLETQILIDLIITFPPLIGSFFSWLNSCLTRNAAMIYKFMVAAAEKRASGETPAYVGPRSVPPTQPRGPVPESQPRSAPSGAQARVPQTKPTNTRSKDQKSKATESYSVGAQQSGFV